MENNSGQGKLSSVPIEIDNWNWGAFLFNWIWGIGNNTYIAFLMFVPLVNMVMPFVLGAKGSAWAWRNKRWESVEQFRQIQIKWAKWSIITYVALIVIIPILIFSIMSGMKSSDAYKVAEERLQSNSQIISILGAPISTGMPMGSIETTGPTGKANMSFSVDGVKQTGTVYFEATKDLGKWQLKRAVIEFDSSGERIEFK